MSGTTSIITRLTPSQRILATGQENRAKGVISSIVGAVLTGTFGTSGRQMGPFIAMAPSR